MADLTGAEAILAELEALSIQVGTDGRVLDLVGPRGALPAELAEEIRSHKRDLLELVELQRWPEASRDAVRRFRVPHARLFPFVGQPVVTPVGRGRLVEVFPDRAGVHLAGRVFAFLPSEIRPPEISVQAEDPFEPVH